MEGSSVTVEANPEGDVITKSPNNPDWGWIRVIQNRHLFDETSGILKIVFCSALVQGRLKDLRKLRWKNGQILPGKIIYKDSLEPYRKVDSHRDFKIAGKTGIVCSINGNPIYRKYFYSANPEAQDTHLNHDGVCKECIRNEYERNKVEAEVEQPFEI